MNKKNNNLVKCPDCGRLFSIHAKCCPVCACPIEFVIKGNKQKKSFKNKKTKKIVAKEQEKVLFYDAASNSEKSILILFKKLINELLPDHELSNTQTTYGFYDKSVKDIGKNGNFYYPKRCWISRDKKTRKLNLHYKEKVNSSEKVLQLTSSQKVEYAFRKLRIAYNSKTINEVKSIVERIKNHDEFDTYITSNIIDVNLMPHQKAGVELANKYNKFAFFFDTGTGKTIMSLEIMMNKFVQNRAKFLVIAPKPLIKSAWLDDSKHFKNMKLLPLSKNMTTEDYARIYDNWQIMDGYERAFTDEEGNLLEKVPKKLLEDIMPVLFAKAHHFIINMQLITKPRDCEELLKKTKCNGMIIDESVMIKNFYSESSKTARRFADYMDYIYILSGKPAPNNISEYYSQMTIVDPKTFPVNGYPTFLKEFFITKNFRGAAKIERAKAGAYEKIGRMVDNRSITVSKEDCIKLPEKFEQIRSVEVDSNTMGFYENVLNNFVAEVKTMAGETLRTKQMAKIATIMKLREIASGFYLDNSTNTWRINDHKVKAIKDLVEEIGYDSTGKRNKVLIWCTFKYEIRALKEALESEGYKVGVAYSETREDLYKVVTEGFQNGDTEILIAHPQTLKYGFTLTNCHYCIYSSMSYSYDDYYQSESRLIRKGQENLCMFYFMQSENTIDETIYKCVTEKGKQAKIFERVVKSISKHGYTKEQVQSLLDVSEEVKYAVTNDKDIYGSC